MKTFKKILYTFPEYYLVVLVILSGYTPPFFINPISLGLALLIVLLLIIKSRVVGLIIAGLFAAVNLFMVLPLVSEFKEFSAFNSDSIQLLIGGIGLIIFNVFVVEAMVYRYQMLEKKIIMNVVDE